MIEVLLWVSLISGGILVLLMIVSLVGGLDLDVDVDLDGGGDADSSAGGIGLVKGALTFISVSTWVMKMMMTSSNGNVGIALIVALISGALAFWILNKLFVTLLSNEENVNFNINDALHANGEVYLRVPESGGSGIVNVEVKGAIRELKAKSAASIEIPTGTPIVIVDIDGEFALVEKKYNLT